MGLAGWSGGRLGRLRLQCTVRQIFLALVLTSIGCSAPDTITLRQFRERELDASCAKGVYCGEWKSIDRCVTVRKPEMEARIGLEESLVSSGALTFSPSFAEECLAEWRDNRCAPTVPLACQRAISHKAMPGEPCDWLVAQGCQDGVCSRELAICLRVLPVGAHCSYGISDGDCASADGACAYACSPVTRRCLAWPTGIGAKCAAQDLPCPDGLVCSWEGTADTCVDGYPAGSFCLSKTLCGKWLQCCYVDDSVDAQCKLPAELGRTCDQCVVSAYHAEGKCRFPSEVQCSTQEICERVGAPGEHCDAGQPCSTGAICPSDARVCPLPALPGDSCVESDRNCVASVCRLGKCSPGVAGISCSLGQPCSPGMYCEDSHCVRICKD